MDIDYKFDFFKPIEKRNFAKDAMLTLGSIGIFMSSCVLPVAYFMNYKEKPISINSLKPAVVMRCIGDKEITCSTDTTFFHLKAR